MHTLKATCTRCGKKDAFVTTRDGYRCICGNYVPYRIDRPLNRNQALTAIMDGMVLRNRRGGCIGYLYHGHHLQKRFVYIDGEGALEEIMNYDWEDEGTFKCIGRWEKNGEEHYSQFSRLKNVEGLQRIPIGENIIGRNGAYEMTLRA